MATYRNYLREAQVELDKEEREVAIERIKVRLKEIRKMRKILAKAENDLEYLLDKDL